jgi:MFS family permease
MHLPRSSIAATCAVALSSFFVFTMQEPLAPLLLLQSRIAPEAIGLILGTSCIGSVFIPVPVGLAIRRFGFRVPLVAATGLLAGSYLALGVFPSLVTMFFALFAIEAGKIAVILGQQLRIGELSGASDTSRDFGWYSSAVFLGQMAGPVTAGFAIDRFGYSPAWIFMSVLMTGICAAYAFIIPKTPPRPRTSPGISLTAECRESFTPIAGAAMFASFALVFSIGIRMTFYPIFLADHYSGTAIGFLIGLRSFAAIGSRFFLSRFIRLCGGRVRALLVVMAVLALALAAVPLGSGFLLQTVNTLLYGLAFGIGTPLTMSLATDYVHRDRRELSMALRLTANQIAFVLNPLVFGFVAASYGYGRVFLLSGGFIFLCGAAVASFLAHKLKRV